MGKRIGVESLEKRLLFAIESLDPSFDGDGVASIVFNDLGDLTQVHGNGVAVSPTGRVFVAGAASNNSATLNWATIAAFNGSTGAADPTFGNAGRAIYTPGPSYIPEFNTVTVQNNGFVLAAGRNDFFAVNGDMLIARYDLSGVPDPTFGAAGTGFVTVGVASQSDFANSVHVVGGGSVLVLGEISRDFGLAQVTSAGLTDGSFNGGQRRTDWYGGRDTINDGAVQTDGKIIAVGQAFSAPTNGDMHPVLARYSSTGTLDPTFGVGGKLDADSIFGHGSLTSVAMQADGKIVVAGQTSVGPRMYIARFTANGVLDTSFSGDGIEYVGSNNTMVDLSIAIESDTTILYSFTDNDQSFVEHSYIGKLTPYGVHDPRFGVAGVMALVVPNNQTTLSDLAILPNGKAVLGGGVTPSSGIVENMAAFQLDIAPSGATTVLTAGVLQVNGTSGDDSVIIENDFVGSIRITVNGALTGQFAFNSVQFISINTLGGDDLVRMEQVLFIPVTFNGNTGRDGLIFKASNGSDNDLVINATHIVGGGNEASITAVEDITVDAMSSTDSPIIDVGSSFAGNLRVEGGGEADTFDIRTAPTGSLHVTVSGGAGDDTIVFSTAMTQGVIVSEGGAGNDKVQMDGGTGADLLSLFEGFAAINSGMASGLGGMERVQINGNGGNDSFALGGLPAGMIATLDGGAGNDSFSLTSNPTLTKFNSSTLNVIGGADTDELLLSGQLQATSIAVALTATRLSWVSRGLLLDFDATIEAVRLFGGTANDSFDVTPSPSALFTINGMNPTRNIPGDVLNLIPGSAAGLAIGSSTLTSTNRQPIAFQNIETFQNVSSGPFVMDYAFNFETEQALTLNFSAQMSNALLSYPLQAENISTGQTFVGLAAATGGPNIQSSVSWHFSAFGAMPDGNYRITLPAASAKNNGGQPMAADFVYNFFILGGDANRDRKVDAADLGTLAANWQGTSRSFSKGDFNYDTKVDIKDLYILASKWQTSVATLPPLAVSAVQTQASAKRAPARVASLVL